MRRVRWAFQARRDFIRITDFFAAKDPDYPDRVLAKIHALSQLLAERPRLGAELTRAPYREMRVHGTDYILIYRADRSELVVARVRHAKEDWRPL